MNTVTKWFDGKAVHFPLCFEHWEMTNHPVVQAAIAALIEAGWDQESGLREGPIWRAGRNVTYRKLSRLDESRFWACVGATAAWRLQSHQREADEANARSEAYRKQEAEQKAAEAEEAARKASLPPSEKFTYDRMDRWERKQMGWSLGD